MGDKMKHQRIRYKAEAKFLKFAEFNRLIDDGGALAVDGRKGHRQARDTWTKRQSTNVTGFHKPPKKVQP